MSTTFDHVADNNGAELHRLSKIHPLPEFVKKANMAETFQPVDLPPTVYGDDLNRRYPCHNKAATWLSVLYFHEKKAEYNPTKQAQIKQRLDHFIDYWAIKGAVDAMTQRHDSLQKNADDQLPDSDFAYVWTGEDGSKVRNLRIKNAQEVGAAANWLKQYRDQLPFSDRHVIATKILEKAARYGATLGEHENFIEKQAGHGVCNPDDVVAMLTNRACLAKTAEHREAIMKLAHIVAAQPQHALVPDQLIKLAETVDIMDRAMNLAGRYTDTLPRPEDVIFKATYKEVRAAVDDSCALTSGTVYSKDDLGKIKLADVQSLFGSDFADEISSGLNNVDAEKLAELVATMPRDDAETFDKLAKEVGISPIRVKAASAASQVPQEVMTQAGAQY
jgi:hypothetical protein